MQDFNAMTNERSDQQLNAGEEQLILVMISQEYSRFSRLFLVCVHKLETFLLMFSILQAQRFVFNYFFVFIVCNKPV